jgi:hypothetical protein
VFLTSHSVQTESHFPGGDLAIYLNHAQWRPELFFSHWTYGNATLGCVVSSRPGYNQTQQFFTHSATKRLAFSSHFIAWREPELMLATLQTMSLRSSASRMTMTTLIGDTPMRMALAFTAWKDFPRLRVKRVKAAFYGEVEIRDVGAGRRLGAGVRVEWANGAAIYCGVHQQATAFSLRVPLGNWKAKVLFEITKEGTGINLKVADGND